MRPAQGAKSTTSPLWLPSIVTCATLGIAYLTWQATERQADIAASLQQLEYARSEPTYTFTKSPQSAAIGGLQLPRRIGVNMEGVVAMKMSSDASTEMTLQNGTSECELVVRGVYIDDNATLNLFEPIIPDFEHLLGAFQRSGLSIIRTSVRIQVRYQAKDGRIVFRDYLVEEGQPSRCRHCFLTG